MSEQTLTKEEARQLADLSVPPKIIRACIDAAGGDPSRALVALFEFTTKLVVDYPELGARLLSSFRRSATAAIEPEEQQKFLAQHDEHINGAIRRTVDLWRKQDEDPFEAAKSVQSGLDEFKAMRQLAAVVKRAVENGEIKLPEGVESVKFAGIDDDDDDDDEPTFSTDGPLGFVTVPNGKEKVH